MHGASFQLCTAPCTEFHGNHLSSRRPTDIVSLPPALTRSAQGTCVAASHFYLLVQVALIIAWTTHAAHLCTMQQNQV